jgi:hypothetical protein
MAFTSGPMLRQANKVTDWDSWLNIVFQIECIYLSLNQSLSLSVSLSLSLSLSTLCSLQIHTDLFTP